jgi:hypothetical protein
MQLKGMGGGLEGMPSFEFSLEENAPATAQQAVVDLGKWKVTPGIHVIAFYGSAVTKYSPEALVSPSKKANSGSDSVKTRDIVDLVVSEPIILQINPAETP